MDDSCRMNGSVDGGSANLQVHRSRDDWMKDKSRDLQHDGPLGRSNTPTIETLSGVKSATNSLSKTAPFKRPKSNSRTDEVTASLETTRIVHENPDHIWPGFSWCQRKFRVTRESQQCASTFPWKQPTQAAEPKHDFDRRPGDRLPPRFECKTPTASNQVGVGIKIQDFGLLLTQIRIDRHLYRL